MGGAYLNFLRKPVQAAAPAPAPARGVQPPPRTGADLEFAGPPSAMVARAYPEDPLPPGRITDPSVLYQRGGQEIAVPQSSYGRPMGGNLEALPSRFTPAPTPQAGSYDLSLAGLEGRIRTKEMLEALHGGGEPYDPKQSAIENTRQDIELERLGPAEGANATPRPPMRWSEKMAQRQQDDRRASIQSEMEQILARQGDFLKSRMAEMMQTPEFQRGDDMVRARMAQQARDEAADFAAQLEERILAREAALSGKVPGQYFDQR